MPIGPVPVIERVPDARSARALPLGHLSEFFDPFLLPFALDTLRVGGEVWDSRAGDAVDGLFLYLDSEGFGSIFTRDPAVAQAFSTFHPGRSIYSDFPFGSAPEVYGVYEGDLASEPPGHRFRHAVRLALGPDREAVVRLMRDVHEVVDPRWFEPMVREDEVGFVVEGGNELAGAGWVSVASDHARLHSLTVRSRYRRTGVATDLWHARAAWAAQAGARRLVTEISDLNSGSRALAEAQGMRRVGQIYRCVGP
ncbi:MAG TPA: GNAT family N-acetyltransferase [Thermoplasmata archaeon]|nr:GNAT family N-acetyltransferase [Thermoplasmata archaeon]